MLTKFETRSNRVKGISFHRTRPWILCGLHNGTVQLWDYRMNTNIDRFEEHDGPVRGVDFHREQPLFVTGGDDYKVKVWNFKLRRCLYTLFGHLDYIRTVQFHHEQPWILSASDDQAIRIWNWQSRTCVSLLTGHNHYVMCAQFHPREDLIVSASLDLTIRVWDISGVRGRKESSVAQDLFGANDVVVKFILEGHEKGVNWASFHPTKPYIVSGADDRSIRIWKMDDMRTYEVEQLRGHMNNVSCVMYYKDLIVSNSEDRTIRVWDPTIRNSIFTHRRDMDRFWVLAVHPEANLLAGGHDNGMMVFKLERERPAMTIMNNILYYVKDRQLRTYDFATKAETNPMTLRRHNYPPMTLSLNPADNMAALWYDYDGGVFELFTVPKPGTIADAEVKKGFYTSAVFFTANKFAVLDKTGQIVIRSTTNEISKVIPAVNGSDRLFPGPQGFLLCRNDEKVFLFHVAQRAVTAEVVAPKTKYVVWDKDHSKVALQSKTSITVATRKLKTIATINETRIKSCCFDEENDTLYYTTLHHLKYCSLRSGETGTIRTLPEPIYLLKAKGDTFWYLSREGKVVEGALDNTEMNFKTALHQERFREVLKIIQQKKLQGQSLVAYLHKQGHPDIAMHFVSDPIVRFNLAVESGAMDIAKEAAQKLNTPECWKRLSESATKFGDIQLAQLASAKVQAMHSLGLMCVYTGNMPALSQVMQKSKDENFQMQFSLFTGEVEQRIQNLAKAGQYPLAFSLARSNGLTEIAEQLLERMPPEVAERAKAIKVAPAVPPQEVEMIPDNWPMLPVQESYFTRMLKEPGLLDYQPEEVATAGGNWGDDDSLDLDGDGGADDGFGGDDIDNVEGVQGDIGGGEWDDDLDIDTSMLPATESGSAGKGGFVVPREGESMQKHWVDNSQLPLYHVAAGSFATALQLLQRQVGLVDGKPLQQIVMSTWAAANAAQPTWAPLPSHNFAIGQPAKGGDLRAKHSPLLPSMLPNLHARVKAGYSATTDGKFAEALKIFESILHQILFTETEDEAQLNELREILAVAREYVQALNVETERKSATTQARAIELACYFTHFKLQPTHLILTMGQAMTQTYKAKNIKLAGSVARRLLDLDPPKERADKAKKVVQLADANPTDALKIDYDERNPFTLCSVEKKPMYRGTVEPVRCSYCYAAAHSKYKGEKCPVCKIARFGGFASGMMTGVWQQK